VRVQEVQQQPLVQPLVQQVQVVERARGQPLVLLVREQEQEHRRYRQLLQLLFPPERCHLRVRESQ
jgi:cytochrome P450